MNIINIAPSPRNGKPSVEQVKNYLAEVSPYVTNQKQIMSCMNIRKLLEFDLDFNQMAFSVSDKFKAKLLLACPGSGKTFTINEGIVLKKIYQNIEGKNILCLSYNNHTVKSIATSHDALVRRLKRKINNLNNLDGGLKSYTFHKLAQVWVKTCRIQCGLPDFNYLQEVLLAEHSIDEILKKAIEALNKKNDWSIDLKIITELKSYINYHREKMYTEPDDRLPEGITQEQFKAIFNRYYKVKNINNKIDFVDCLVLFNKLLDSDDFKNKMIHNYKLIVVDEYQDCSPLMVSCLRKLNDLGIDIIAVADDDQSIYDFRGADSNNCLRFENDFNNAGIFTLTYNRRCRQNIVDYCNGIRNEISTHIDKNLMSNKDNGNVNIKTFSTIELQNLSVIDDIFSSEGTTCLAYRDNADSINLTLQLLQQKVPFKVVKGYMPFQDSLFRSLHDIFTYLARPYSISDAKKALPKITPLNTDQIEEIMSAYDNYSMPPKPNKINFGKYNDVKKLDQVMDMITKISDDVQTGESTTSILKKINGYFLVYYWEFVRDANKFPIEQEARVYEIFDSALDVESFLDYIDNQIEVYKTLSEDENAVILTTFHGTKGLEFDNVIGYNIDAESIDDEEKRLLYVLCSRAKNNLTLYVKNNINLFSKLEDEFDSDVITKVEENDEVTIKDNTVSMEEILFNEYENKDNINIGEDELFS